MKRIKNIVLVTVLSMILVTTGAYAKGKPASAGAGNSKVQSKKVVAVNKNKKDKSDDYTTQTNNQAKNRGQAKKLEERIRVRGMNLKFDVPPVIKEGRTLIPVRAIMNGLGATVEWDAETKTVTITRDDKIVVLNLASATATINGEEIELDVPAQIMSNRTFVPLRFVAQSLGDCVNYDEETGDIDIGDENDADEDENETDESTDESTDENGDAAADESDEDSTYDTGDTVDESDEDSTNDTDDTDDNSTDDSNDGTTTDTGNAIEA